MMYNIKYLLAGVYFGIVLFKSEVISWFRIQEMFRFQSFHMYGIIGLGVVVGAIALLIMKRMKMSSVEGETIKLKDKKFNKGVIIGGVIFGLGWAFTGACPGPIYALVGSGYGVFIITLLSALGGVITYGLLQKKLPQ